MLHLTAVDDVTVVVSVAVCETFSVKEWRDLENQVRGRSRSLKMAPFDDKNRQIFMKFCTQQQILNWMNIT